MITRSNFENIKANPAILFLPADRNVEFFFDEKEAYRNCPVGYSAVVRQWDMILDDATDEELAALKQQAENIIAESERDSINEYGENYVNDSQKELIRQLYNHVAVYSCWYISKEEEKEDLRKAMMFNTFEEEDEEI